MTGQIGQASLLEPIETASRDELIALQIERLKWTLHRVYDRVPHSRAKFDATGVHPDDLKTLADLAKFPFTTKKDLRDGYPFGLFAMPRKRDRAGPRLLWDHRAANRGRLFPARPRRLGERHGAIDARRRCGPA